MEQRTYVATKPTIIPAVQSVGIKKFPAITDTAQIKVTIISSIPLVSYLLMLLLIAEPAINNPAIVTPVKTQPVAVL